MVVYKKKLTFNLFYFIYLLLCCIFFLLNLTRNEYKTNHAEKVSITNIEQVQIPYVQEQPGGINMLTNQTLQLLASLTT